jgi:hypothetical protein
MLRMVGPAHGDRGDHPGQGAGNRDDVGGLDRHIGAGADRRADVGSGEGGGVVDAITDHGDLAAFGLKPLDLAGLVLG